MSGPVLEGLVCCQCRQPLTEKGGNALACSQCGVRYAIEDGAYILFPASVAVETHPEEVYWRDLAAVHERPWREAKDHLAQGLQQLFIARQRPQGNILEIGAGSCWASSLVKAANPAARVTASDISPSVLQRAAPLSEEIGGRIDRFVACDMERLPFADNYFDWVFGVAVLHHAEDLAAVFSEVQRVLKPGGRYFGMDEFATNAFFRWWWRVSPWSPFSRRHDELGVQEEVHTLADWRQAVLNAGFSEVQVRFNRDWRFKRSAGFRRQYFRLSAALPERWFALLPGGSIVIEATK